MCTELCRLDIKRGKEKNTIVVDGEAADIVRRIFQIEMFREQEKEILQLVSKGRSEILQLRLLLFTAWAAHSNGSGRY